MPVLFNLPIINEFGPIVISHQSIPGFATFSAPTYTISPKKCTDVGIYQVILTAKNQYLSRQFAFTIKVINDAPTLTQNTANVEVNRC